MITVNGASVASPVTALAAGGDSTLLVYGAPGTATASLITDDNHLPTRPPASRCAWSTASPARRRR